MGELRSVSDTITLWFTKAKDSPPGAAMPSAEMHFNLWRHVRSRKADEDFLDVGILLRNAEQLGTLSIYLPFTFKERPQDLMGLLREKQHLLRGVFNEVVEFGASVGVGQESFTVQKGRRHYLTCHGGLNPSRLTTRVLEDSDRTCGTILTFEEPFCAGMREPGGHYLRFRIGLDAAASVTFSSKKSGSEGSLSLNWKQREYTEIRFNEMRSIQSSLQSTLDRDDRHAVPISAVHAFLLRDMAFELLAAHSPPYKVRLLEADLWRGYAPETFGSDLGRFVVYHWKKEFDPPMADQSVVVFAKFSYESAKVYAYVVGIILLGATGSALQAVSMSLCNWPAWRSLMLLALCWAVLYLWTDWSDLLRRFGWARLSKGPRKK
jgi:hypothetical protein